MVSQPVKNYECLLFHVKIEDEFHTLTINKLNNKSCNLECVDGDCPTKYKLSCDEQFVQRNRMALKMVIYIGLNCSLDRKIKFYIGNIYIYFVFEKFILKKYGNLPHSFS